MAWTTEDYNNALKNTYEWAKSQLSDANRAAIKASTDKLNQGTMLLSTKYGSHNLMGGNRPFEIWVLQSTITNPPRIETADGKTFYPTEIRGTIKQSGYFTAAYYFWAMITGWEHKTGRVVNPDNLTEVFGKSAPITVNYKDDKTYVNFQMSVCVRTQTPNSDWQLTQLGSEIEGKVLNAASADAILNPVPRTDGKSDSASALIVPSAYFGKNDIIKTRVASLTVVPYVSREVEIDTSDLDAMFNQDVTPVAPVAPVAPAAPAPQQQYAQPAQPQYAPAPQQAPAAPAVANNAAGEPGAGDEFGADDDFGCGFSI